MKKLIAASLGLALFAGVLAISSAAGVEGTSVTTQQDQNRNRNTVPTIIQTATQTEVQKIVMTIRTAM